MSGRRASGRRGRSVAREDAYTLVTLMILVTVLNVMVAAALPLWSHQIQRDKEEELIFRGLQYAEAIRLFQKRFGRYPVRLEELHELEPRSIRQLWTEPMSKDGEWGLVFAAGTVGGRQDEVQHDTGPIRGVHSVSDEESIKTFMGSNTYSAWVFTPEVIPIAPTAPGEIVPSLNSRWVGRPFPEGLEPESGEGVDDEFDDDDDEDEEEETGRRLRRKRRERGSRDDGE